MTEDERERLGALKALSEQDYLHALLIGPALRADFVILRSYHRKLCDIVAKAREPQLAEIQLQWWAEGIEGGRRNELASHPLGAALIGFVERCPEATSSLAAKATAHAQELYADIPPDVTQFEGHAGETRSILAQLLWLPLEGGGKFTDASGHYGVAEMVVENLLSLPRLRAKQHAPMPATLFAKCGSPPADWLASDDPDGGVVRAFAEYGLTHCSAARSATRSCPPDGRRIYSALRLYESFLKRVLADPSGAIKGKAAPGRLAMQYLLWRG